MRERPVEDSFKLLEDRIHKAAQRLKDLADIARVLETRPELADGVPAAIREKLR